MSNWDPRYNGESKFKKKNRYKLEDGDVVFRILPPPDYETRGDGVWSKYISVHFGYKNMEGKARPFASPLVKNNKTKMIEVPDAALDRLNDLKAKLEKARAEKNGPLEAKLKTLVGFGGVYSVDNNHHMNVIGLDGNIGVLKLRYKAKLALDEEIARLRKENVNPLSFDDGRFFVFTRTGTNNDTAFKVSVYTEKLDIPGVGKVEKPVVHKVTQEILNKLKTDGQRLEDIALTLTSEEVAKVVATSDLLTGKSPACDEYFDNRWKAKRAAKTETQGDDSNDGDDNYNSTTGTNYGPTTVATPATTTVTVNATLPPTTQPAQTMAQPAAQTTVASTGTKAVDEMSDDEFFKMIGKQA
jgi:hypothetical protein